MGQEGGNNFGLWSLFINVLKMNVTVCVKKTFPFPLATAELIGDYFYIGHARQIFFSHIQNNCANILAHQISL